MNIELKKVNWATDNIPSTPQTLSLSFRRQDAPDVADSYTLVTDSLFVLTNGTVVNPPLIKGLENITTYVFRLSNSSVFGNNLDIIYTTPQELAFPAISGEYMQNGKIDYVQEDANFYAGMNPGGIAFYTMENNFKDLNGHYSNIQGSGDPAKALGYIGMYIDSQMSNMIAADLNMANMFGTNSARTYALGVYFYASAGELSSTGIWPLLSCLDRNGYGVLVYVDNATKKIVWQQRSSSLTETITSTTVIVPNSWNNVLVGSYSVGLTGSAFQSYMYLNGASVASGSISGAASLPELTTAPMLYVGSAAYGSGYKGKGIFRNVFVTSSLSPFIGDLGFSTLTHPVGYLQDWFNPDTVITIPHDHLIFVSPTKLSFTIPMDVMSGRYNFYVTYNGITTAPLDITIRDIYKNTNAFDIDMTARTDMFDPTIEFQLAFYGVGENRNGGADGGVSTKNIYFKDDMLVLEAHGDWYEGLVQGLDTDGSPKKHTDIGDPLLGDYWKTRVGAAVATKQYYGYGRYIVEAKLPKLLGASPFFKLYHHASAQFQDPFYEQCINNGIHQQGITFEGEGFYAVVKNEFSMELPANNSVFVFDTLNDITITYFFNPYAGMKVIVRYDEPANNGTWQLNVPAAPKLLSSWTKYSDDVQYLYQPHRDQVKLTNAKGELGSGVGFSPYYPSTSEEYMEMRAAIGKDIWDDAYHEFRMDWFANKVEYYIDGVLIQTNPYFVPDIAGRFSFGLSFPSETQYGSSWLPNPEKLSAGSAAWHHQSMMVRRVKFTPFSDATAGGTNREVGETSPYDGLFRFPYVSA